MSLVWLVMFLARAGVWSVVEDRRAAPEARWAAGLPPGARREAELHTTFFLARHF